MDLSYDVAVRSFIYSPETGGISRKRDSLTPRLLSAKDYKGYLRVVFNGKCYRGHRLAWLLQTGEWPSKSIDHIDGDRMNNRWSNLREATLTENNQNRRDPSKASTSGALGVSRTTRGKPWRAQIKINGKPKHLGAFDTVEQAQEAYVKAKRELHSGCTL